ncbi:hypothetical protein B0H17DRAFT_1060900 [Mycena rosella]|uniref:Uncharacterized protein n=1 Tax=Mycena rosella TaxID=1033263 RepID=A0AAD7DKA5_MYCRO|nr:hypothetical protein B0H17DRAFT_1060900 [Mycena rosella]
MQFPSFKRLATFAFARAVAVAEREPTAAARHVPWRSASHASMLLWIMRARYGVRVRKNECRRSSYNTNCAGK